MGCLPDHTAGLWQRSKSAGHGAGAASWASPLFRQGVPPLLTAPFPAAWISPVRMSGASELEAKGPRGKNTQPSTSPGQETQAQRCEKPVSKSASKEPRLHLHCSSCSPMLLHLLFIFENSTQAPCCAHDTLCGRGRLGVMRTGARPDVGHVDEGSGALEEGWVVQGDAGAETLRVDGLAELSVCHRDGGLVVSCGKKGRSAGLLPSGTIRDSQASLCLSSDCQENDPLD